MILIVDKEIKFTIKLNDEATAEMNRIRQEILKFSQTSASATVGVAQGAVGVPGTSGSDGTPSTPKAPKSTSASKGKGDPNAQIPGEWARPLRAAGMYRTAWLAGQDLSGKGAGGVAMAGAAGIFIFKAIGAGIGKIVEILQQASPALRAELKIIGKVINLMLQPIGDLLASVLRPIARTLLASQVSIRRIMGEQGFKPGTELYASKYQAQSMSAIFTALTQGRALSDEQIREAIGTPPTPKLFGGEDSTWGSKTTVTDTVDKMLEGQQTLAEMLNNLQMPTIPVNPAAGSLEMMNYQLSLQMYYVQKQMLESQLAYYQAQQNNNYSFNPALSNNRIGRGSNDGFYDRAYSEAMGQR